MKNEILSVVIGLAVGFAFIVGFSLGSRTEANARAAAKPDTGYDVYEYRAEAETPRYEYDYTPVPGELSDD